MLIKPFSVLMSVYYNDKPDFLDLALKSIWNEQTVRPTEIILVKDGFLNEKLDKVIDTFAKEAPLIIVALNKNCGLANALNEGYKRCTCEFIARMDADDISLPKRFEKQLIYLDKNIDIDSVGTWAIEINSFGNEYFKKQMPVKHIDCLRLFRKRDCYIHPTVMFRRSYFEKAGLYPTDTYFGEDTMMWANGFANGCKFANIPEFLFKFRLDSRFFERRRGWMHAKSIFNLRRKVNKLLNFGFKEDLYALLYAMVKIMPTKVLNCIYKIAR